MNPLHLFAFCLFSKWGFNDGALVLDWLYDAEDAGQDVDGLDKADYHQALRQLVRDHLAPLLPAATLYDIETSHNPIRVRTWYGKEWDDYADAPPEVEHVSAEVPGELVKAALAATLT